MLDGAEIAGRLPRRRGALVTPGMRVPAGRLRAGNPARVVRELRDDERAGLLASAANYVRLRGGVPRAPPSADPLAALQRHHDLRRRRGRSSPTCRSTPSRRRARRASRRRRRTRQVREVPEEDAPPDLPERGADAAAGQGVAPTDRRVREDAQRGVKAPTTSATEVRYWMRKPRERHQEVVAERGEGGIGADRVQQHPDVEREQQHHPHPEHDAEREEA